MTAMPMTIQERIPLPPSVPARPAAAGTGLTAADLLRIIRQRLFMILTIWFLIIGATIAATYYCDRYWHFYTARGLVRVDSPVPKSPFRMDEPTFTGEVISRYVADQAMQMKSDDVLRDAMIDPAITSTKWYRQWGNDKILALDELKDELGVSPATGTSFITVTFAAHDAQDAATIVNTVIEKYLGLVQSRSTSQYKEELNEYRVKEKNLEKALDEIMEAKRKFMAEHTTAPGISEGLNITAETLRQYATGVTQLEQEKLQYKSLYDNLSGLSSDQIVVSPEMNMMIQQDPTVSSLRQARVAYEQERQIQLEQYGPNHRSVQQLEARIKGLDQQLQDTLARKEKEIRDYQMNSAYTRYLNAMQAEAQLRERMLMAEDKQRDLDQARVSFQNLEDKQVLTTNELQQMRQFINQLEMMIRDRGIVRVTPTTASKPDYKSFPQWKIMILAGTVLGLLLAVGLAMLLEFMDTTMRTPRDVVRHAHVPILGTVPDLDDEEIPIDRIELAAHSTPRSMTAESFRTIRTNLLLSSPAERQRTVLVTSAKPEEGKSTVACNLAISIAQSGRRVLLIDANFHRPALHQIFNKAQREGLSNFLIGQTSLDDLVQTTELPNLDILTSGPIPPNPTELLSGAYLRELIARASERYDQLVFDGPPVLLLSDSLVLAGTLDGVIMVCRARSTSRGAVQRAREQIDRVNGRVFGAILNAVRIRRGGYYREQIRTYYEYQPEEILAAKSSKALPDKGDDAGKNDKA